MIEVAVYWAITAVLVLVANHRGFHAGYDRAWRDMAKAAREAEMENHRWPQT